MRKKGTSVRRWLVLSSSGVPQELEAGKQAIMRRTLLPARDLRLLDPKFPSPSTILGRERAIIVNLEHIKAIILAHEVLLPNYKDPQTTPFVEDLKRRLPPHFNALGQQVPGDGGGGMNDLGSSSNLVHINCNHKGPKVLPFEFRAFEACLEAICGRLEIETAELEKQAYPTLDELTMKISTLMLEKVRLIKSRLVVLSGRAQKVRDQIEQLLDDDGDMAQMYLTSKANDLYADPPSPSASSELEEMDGQNWDHEEQYPENEETGDFFRGLLGEGLENLKWTGSSSSISVKNVDVSELEMLLEAYFVQIDGTLNKLSTLREYVDDTDDYLNIMLDDKQNQLLQMGIRLSSATLATNTTIVVTGVFGMNIDNDLYSAGLSQFLWVVFMSTVGAVLLHFVVMACCKKLGLLD